MKGAPAALGGVDLAALLADLAGQLAEVERGSAVDEAFHDLLATMACHAAVRANQERRAGGGAGAPRRARRHRLQGALPARAPGRVRAAARRARAPGRAAVDDSRRNARRAAAPCAKRGCNSGSARAGRKTVSPRPRAARLATRPRITEGFPGRGRHRRCIGVEACRARSPARTCSSTRSPSSGCGGPRSTSAACGRSRAAAPARSSRSSPATLTGASQRLRAADIGVRGPATVGGRAAGPPGCARHDPAARHARWTGRRPLAQSGPRGPRPPLSPVPDRPLGDLPPRRRRLAVGLTVRSVVKNLRGPRRARRAGALPTRAALRVCVTELEALHREQNERAWRLGDEVGDGRRGRALADLGARLGAAGRRSRRPLPARRRTTPTRRASAGAPELAAARDAVLAAPPRLRGAGEPVRAGGGEPRARRGRGAARGARRARAAAERR